MVGQALRAFAYGFAAVWLGVTLDRRGLSSAEVGLVLTAVVAGTVVAQLVLARWAQQWGRRRCYIGLYLTLAVVGCVFAASSPWWVLALVSLTGSLSTEVVESGPFTSLEQALLASELRGNEWVHGFGIYNAVATAAGSLGALAAVVPPLVRERWGGAPPDERWFAVLVVAALAGAVVARSLSPDSDCTATRDADVPGTSKRRRSPRPAVVRLAGLFALDSFGGGFVVQAFIAYWLTARFGASAGTIGVTFFTVGVLQTGSFMVAPILARRWGLLNTMVFTHLPSNVLLAAMAFAPNLAVAITLLLMRVVLSQMDVPTRQAYLMALVGADERTAAAAYTNTARTLARPVGPALAGAAQSVALGLPFLIAGSIKSAYDLILWRWFRSVPLPPALAPGPGALGAVVGETEASP